MKSLDVLFNLSSNGEAGFIDHCVKMYIDTKAIDELTTPRSLDTLNPLLNIPRLSRFDSIVINSYLQSAPRSFSFSWLDYLRKYYPMSTEKLRRQAICF